MDMYACLRVSLSACLLEAWHVHLAMGLCVCVCAPCLVRRVCLGMLGIERSTSVHVNQASAWW